MLPRMKQQVEDGWNDADDSEKESCIIEEEEQENSPCIKAQHPPKPSWMPQQILRGQKLIPQK